MNSEEIILYIEQVKHKKNEGTLYLMGERIAWMPKNQDQFTVSYHYADIKTHKISTEGKSKIQLQIVMHDDNSATFHFISSLGMQQQIKDRDKIKEYLLTLLPKFKQKISKDLEEKKCILKENPHLYQLYNDIVVMSVVSPENFWKYCADDLKSTSTKKTETKGVSQSFLSNISPKSDGTNDITYNLTIDDVQSIFKTYPSVRQKYSQNVPHKMSEIDFWTKFFQSHYFHRDRIASSSTDLFADCIIKDDEDLKSKAKMDLNGNKIDLNDQKDIIIGEGYGLIDALPNNSINLANQNLIKRYNYYSIRVLSSMDETVNESRTSLVEAHNKAHKKVHDEEILDLSKKSDSIFPTGTRLNLTNTGRYFNGPKSRSLNDFFKGFNKNDSLFLQQYKTNLQLVSNYNIVIKETSNASISLSVLKELSPGGDLMTGSTIKNLYDEIPRAIQDEMKHLYVSICELLRHFYSAFPPTTLELENKFNVMKEALEGFQQNKMLTFRDKLARENFTWNLMHHLENMLKVAFTRYNNWKLKQLK